MDLLLWASNFWPSTNKNDSEASNHYKNVSKNFPVHFLFFSFSNKGRKSNKTFKTQNNLIKKFPTTPKLKWIQVFFFSTKVHCFFFYQPTNCIIIAFLSISQNGKRNSCFIQVVRSQNSFFVTLILLFHKISSLFLLNFSLTFAYIVKLTCPFKHAWPLNHA